MSVFLVERVRIPPLSFAKPPAVEGCSSGKVFWIKIRPEQVEIFHQKPAASVALAEHGLFPKYVIALENVKQPDSRHVHICKLWLFSFYFAGMRVSDIFRLKWSDFQNYRLHYSMNKNDKTGSFKVQNKAKLIPNHYKLFKLNKDDLVFPELKGADLNNEFEVQRIIAYKTSAINKLLRKYVAHPAEIDAPLTMHIARHTFGSLLVMLFQSKCCKSYIDIPMCLPE